MARKKTNNSGKRYGKDFIAGAVRLVAERGYTVAEASRQLGVTAWSLGKWVPKYRESGQLVVDSKTESLVDEVKRLRAENQRLRMEKEILKNAARYFASKLTRGMVGWMRGARSIRSWSCVSRSA